MTTEPNENLLPESQETVMVYINPDVIQTMAAPLDRPFLHNCQLA